MAAGKNVAFNLFDVLLVVCLLVFIAAGYRLVFAEYRVAPPAVHGETVRWARVTLTVRPELQWICEAAASQPEERDPRTGEILARVQGCTGAPGAQEVDVHVRALTDAEGRAIFRNQRLVPGLALRIETDRAIFEGVVREVVLMQEAPPLP